MKVITSWVYPRVRNIQRHWFPPDPSLEEGIFVIEVVRQLDRDKPFIVRRMVDEAGVASGAIGIPEREADVVEWMRAEEVHARISAAASPLAGFLTAPVVEEGKVERADERLETIEALEGWEGQPFYALQALPPPGPELLPGFFDEDGLRGALRDPPSLRGMGFTLRTGPEPKVVEGGMVSRGHGRTLWLEPDGLFTAAVAGTREFLLWAINDRVTPARSRINTIPLVEFTLEYFRFVELQLRARGGQGDWAFRLHCRRFMTAGVTLGPGNTGVMHWFGEETAASSSTSTRPNRRPALASGLRAVAKPGFDRAAPQGTGLGRISSPLGDGRRGP